MSSTEIVKLTQPIGVHKDDITDIRITKNEENVVNITFTTTNNNVTFMSHKDVKTFSFNGVTNFNMKHENNMIIITEFEATVHPEYVNGIMRHS
jgi:hypothetical protein